MKLPLLAALLLCTSAHAYTGSPHGRSSTAGGQRMAMAPAHAASTSTQPAGSGRSVWAPQESSAFDAYQPWPQSEMRQFAKK